MRQYRIPLITSIISLLFLPARADITLCHDSDLEQMILESSMLHAPLPLEPNRSAQARMAAKEVEASRTLGSDTLILSYSTKNLERARGPQDDPDYAIYGRAAAGIDIPCENWEGFNRISFAVYADYPGAGVTNVNLVFRNDTKQHKDGYLEPTGAHLVNLRNGQWNDCLLEIDDLQRDRVVRLDFYTDIKGRSMPTASDSATYLITDIRVERIANPDKTRGWQPANGVIAHSNSGYDPSAVKKAVIGGAYKGSIESFSLVGDNGAVAVSLPVEYVSTSTGEYGILDFSSFSRPGRYRLKAGEMTTEPFDIATRIWDNSQWRVLNFIYCMRCGDAIPGVHGRCHTDLFSDLDGRLTPFCGGWHDAGDLSQQTLQTAETAAALLEGYLANRKSNVALAARMLEEAKWGLDFVLRNRLGSGYHASSMGLLHWTDGIFGSFDDITTVRVQDKAYDNFLYAAIEAFAASAIDDKQYSASLRRVAVEDFDFALSKFRAEGFDSFTQPYEHTYSTSNSLYYATISLAASRLYALTGEQRFADVAAEMIAPVIACQQATPVGKTKKLCGFFYRDESRRSLVHSIHQSREHIFIEALTAICMTQPGAKDYRKWHRAVELYASYIKGLMEFTAPYAMIPSGVYHRDEHLDEHGFRQLHLFPPHDARERFSAQFEGGVMLGDEWSVKRFPIWFNVFNGNSAVHLDAGKSAAICARFLGDKALRDIAEGQLRWVVGENPFNQSLIYGEGSNYPSLDNFSSGELTGAIPVGIRTHGDTDEPYWPNINNACYKEVWLTSAGKWMSLVAELQAADQLLTSNY